MGQYMRLEQRLTPQLIQAMDILQLPVQALENRLAEELEKNCALELVDDEKLGPEGATEKPASTDGEVEVPAEPSTVEQESESFKRLERLAREYEVDFGDQTYMPRRRLDSGDRDAKLDAMANTASRPTSLNEFLLNQWSLLELDDETRRAGEALINFLEEDGYLRERLETVSEATRPTIPIAALERALTTIQRKLEPGGIGARDLHECLLLQLDRLPGDNQIERTLIQKHLDDISRNRYPAVAKATGYTLGEINEAVNVIKHELHLHPGYLVVDRQVPRINPDVIVDFSEEGAGLTVRLARGNHPRLRVRTDLREMMRNRAVEKNVRDFIRKHVEAADALTDAVNFRRERLLQVANMIVERQHDFFDIGPAGLKILRMSDLAAELGCDPSTISRTVAEKYMMTPRGVFPLRYFFTGGTETGNGESTSWDSVKARVQEIVKEEDKKNPLNDDEIVVKLQAEGIEISRRTVAKYRQQLEIPPARQRREF
jgi:RNA polymerase sigma-54 factor